jgi:hypothetical protein
MVEQGRRRLNDLAGDLTAVAIKEKEVGWIGRGILREQVAPLIARQVRKFKRGEARYREHAVAGRREQKRSEIKPELNARDGEEDGQQQEQIQKRDQQDFER